MVVMACFLTEIAYGQLSLVSDQNIDFTNAVSSVKSGNWSDPSTWSNGQIPTASTDVIIEDGHTVYIDVQGASSGQIVDLCDNLNIKQYGVLQMGHNTDNFAKDIQINGSILCDGTFSAGREQPIGSGDGSLYDYNSRVFLRLTEENTFVSGSGYFHPKALSISSTVADRNLIIDIYTMVIDDNLAIKSSFRVNASIKYHSYVHIKKTLGLTGSVYQFSSPSAKADLNIEGIVVANNVSLFTKNTTSGDSSSITIKNKGSLSVKTINEGALDIVTADGGFGLTIENGGLMRLAKNVDFNNLLQGNPNFTFTNSGELREHYSTTTPTKSQITSKINVYDPNQGANVPQIKDVFGATHIAGWYNFTDRPYLLEGLDYYKQFGSTAIKTTLTAVNGRMFNAYPFNQTWPNFQNLKEVAQHYYIDSLFKRNHIKTHTFWTVTKNQGKWKQGPDFNHDNYLEEEQQFYDLTKYLLETYGDKDKKFIYQNWEGDWMLRGQGVLWENNSSLIPDDIDWLTEGMARLFRARQRGTERARNEFANATAKVLHGIEFNKLWFLINGQRITSFDHGTPGVLENVIPHTRIDMTSWSAYDSSWQNSANPHGHAMYKGLLMAKYYTTDTKEFSATMPVQIGEFGINENPPYNGNNTESVIRNRYGRYIGAALDLGIPNFYLWNLYCSGQQGAPSGFQWEKNVQYDTNFLYEWMDGKWMLEPDGNWGVAANFLMEQWANTLSNEEVDEKVSLRVYPNPSSGRIQILGIDEVAEITILDYSGKTIKQLKVTSNESITLDELSSGVYFVKITTNSNQSITYRRLILY